MRAGLPGCWQRCGDGAAGASSSGSPDAQGSCPRISTRNPPVTVSAALYPSPRKHPLAFLSAPPPGSPPGLLRPSDPPPPAMASGYPGVPLEGDGSCLQRVLTTRCGHSGGSVRLPPPEQERTSPGRRRKHPGLLSVPSGPLSVRSPGWLTASGTTRRIVPCCKARASQAQSQAQRWPRRLCRSPGLCVCPHSPGLVTCLQAPASPRVHLSRLRTCVFSRPASNYPSVSVDVIFSRDSQLLVSPPKCGLCGLLPCSGCPSAHWGLPGGPQGHGEPAWPWTWCRGRVCVCGACPFVAAFLGSDSQHQSGPHSGPGARRDRGVTPAY